MRYWLTSLVIPPQNGHIRELKQRRFWATHVNRKCASSLFIYLDCNKFVLLSFFSLIMRIYSRVSTKPLPNDAKRLLPVEVRRAKTLLLKLPTLEFARTRQEQFCLHDSNLRCCTRYSSLFCSRWWGMNFLKIQESVYGFGGMKCSCNCSAIN